MKSRQYICVLVFMLIQRGRADSEISLSLKKSVNKLVASCSLLEDDRVNQINWVMNRGTNSTKLGTYHPVFGIHIDAQFSGSVEIRGNATERSSQLDLEWADVEDEGWEICCIFNTFPSGVLEKCSVTVETKEADALTEPQWEEEDTSMTVIQWTLMLGGFLVYLASIAVCLYCCWRYCCRLCCWRRRVYEVQPCQTNCSTDSESPHVPALHLPESHLQSQPQSKGYDHSKLYAKIKLDLLYGRLWKAYQGSARVRPPATPQQETQQKVYSLLGEHGPAQMKVVPTEPDPKKVTPPLDLLPEPDPALQCVDTDLPECLSNNDLSCPNLIHNHEPISSASQPESPDPMSKPQSDHVTLHNAISVPDQAQSDQPWGSDTLASPKT
ncbi:uncharacterized protein ACJ7VT_018817 isoform 2-T2 [Polymixia lowei]